MNRILPILALAALLLAACGKPASTAAPTPVPAASGVTLTYQDNAQVELVTPTGRHIYIDVANVPSLTKAPSADDILLTTHLHGDHYYSTYVETFPGQQLFTSEGRIELPDVTITGLASAHNEGDPIQAEGATNYIYVIETGGLRIVHLGDIGQDALTGDQLAAIGEVDMLITQLSNSYSSMNADNLKGFNLVDQIAPRLILPTHSNGATIEIAAGRWPGFYSDSRTVTLSTDKVPEETSMLVLGNLATAYGSMYSLELWK